MKMNNFELSEEDKSSLTDLVKESKEVKRACVLLLLDSGVKNVVIAEKLGISANTVTNIKKRYIEGGKDHAIYDKPRSGQPKKYDIVQETEIIALACTDPPKGHKKWTTRLLAETLRERENFESITRETVRIILKKTRSNLG